MNSGSMKYKSLELNCIIDLLEKIPAVIVILYLYEVNQMAKLWKWLQERKSNLL